MRTRVLMELRPCFDGFAGIPQETRVLFSSFHDSEGIDPVGLLNHATRRLASTKPRSWQSGPSWMRYQNMSRLIISSERNDAPNSFTRLKEGSETPRALASLLAATGFGTPIRLQPFEGQRFVDYLWQRLFAKGLSPAELDRVRQASYVAMRPAWLQMHSMGLTRRYPMIDTKGFDIFVAHTPWPSRVDPTTELVVRYHDAIPIFHPHHIKLPAMHQFHHASALQSNVRSGATFVCNSEATRRDLLTLYPETEDRSPVIPVSVSEDFYPEQVDRDLLAEIVRTHQKGGKPADAHSGDDTFRYLLMVSMIEPRKNHLRMIDAWEQIRRLVDPDLNLVIVGSLGWSHGEIVARIKKGQQRRSLFHLSGVPTPDLRALYANAAATICPSVVEGFDMSGIESMMCGAPVVASDIPVHRENFGDAAAYFDPYDVNDLVEAIRSVLYDENCNQRRADMTHKGNTQAKLYRRGDVADQWAVLFDDLMARRKGHRRRDAS